MDMKKAIRNTHIIRAAAAAVAIAVVAVSAMLPAADQPAPQADGNGLNGALNPNPVVMTVEEMADAVVEEETSEDEERQKKLSFFQKLKLAVYGFFAACGAWVLHKIPWKKIFTRRNLFLALLAAALVLTVYHVGLPALEEYLAQS